MNKLILSFVLFILCVQISAQSVQQLSSPDGNLQFSFELDAEGVPAYSVTYQQVPVVLSSVLGLSGWEKGFIVADVARVEEIDWSVGEIMKTLRANGLEKNTIVIFTSDNGPWLTYGNHAGNTGGLREGKGTAWEGGVRVPFIIHWPAQIAPAAVCNNMAASMDLLPTLVNITGAKQPKKKIDGIDIRSLLQQVPGANPRDEFVYYYDRCSLKGIRKEQWVLTFPCVSQTYKRISAIDNDGFPGKYANDSVRLALYDLRTDPGETLDVKDKYPEVVKELSAIADRYRKTIGDDLTKEPGTEVRPAAKVK